MPSLYDIHFTPEYAGQSATVRDTVGAEVTGSPVTLDASGSGQLELPGGSYTATVTNAALGLGTSTTALHLNLEDSLDADAPGAAETAYFIATGPVYATDGNGAAGNLNFVADPTQGDLPSWVSLSAGDVVLGEDAGTCSFAIAAVCDMDFTEASAIADTPGLLGTGGVTVSLDGDVVATGEESDVTVGDGEVLQTTGTARAGGVVVGTSLTAVLVGPFAQDDASATIADGTATPRAALTVTRLAPAPTLPA